MTKERCSVEPVHKIQPANRSFQVDLLKCIGTLLVILAHVEYTPKWLFYLRSFDVVALVFASGITLKWHGESYNDYFCYIWKRFKRLIIPAWCFIIVYTLCVNLSVNFNLIDSSYYLSKYEVVQSFLLMGGIGPLWIIRVYFVLALVAPLIYLICKNRYYIKYWYLFLLFIILLNELLGIYSDTISSPLIRNIFKGAIVYTIGYSIVELFSKLPSRLFIYQLVFVITVFICFEFIYGFEYPNTYKYPPPGSIPYVWSVSNSIISKTILPF